MSLSVSSSLPRALVSRDALRRGALAALSAGGSVADLRADAWGHGVLETARAVIAAGASAVRVDAEDVDLLRAEGLAASASDEPDLDPALLYGLPRDAPDAADLSPAMSLVGHVMSTKPLAAGEAVSYGYLFRTAVPTRVALVTGGYSQGVFRALGGQAQVEIGGALHPIVGRVAMDVCVVDFGDAEVEERAAVTYFGGTGAARGQLTTWMRASGLTAGELVCAVGQHAPREYTA